MEPKNFFIAKYARMVQSTEELKTLQDKAAILSVEFHKLCNLEEDQKNLLKEVAKSASTESPITDEPKP